MCLSHQSHDGRSGQPKHVVMYNKRLLCCTRPMCCVWSYNERRNMPVRLGIFSLSLNIRSATGLKISVTKSDVRLGCRCLVNGLLRKDVSEQPVAFTPLKTEAINSFTMSTFCQKVRSHIPESNLLLITYLLTY
jgi:hypothetical protein